MLAEAGFPLAASDILTVPVIAAAYLHDRYPGARCLLLNNGDIGEDLAGPTLARQGDQAPADVVLVGGAGPEFSYQALNQAFGHLQRRARLVAMHRGLYWRTSGGLQLDTGAFLAGLEQAAGTEAAVVGKPAPAFFAAALAHLHTDAAHTLMVGDDIETDVLAAQRQGLTGALVKTGKYLPYAPHRQRYPRPCAGLLGRPARPAAATALSAGCAAPSQMLIDCSGGSTRFCR
jgi:HAD superfamily hydrolase (TIGR01450 family)